MSHRCIVAAGADRAVVRLASGEYLAIDTNSVDAINYLLGRPVEPHISFVFRCFLHPHAVVLDIGANFGLYTAITAAVIRTRGRLFAFEPNPRTFGCLLRTLHANGVINNPNITLVNKAAGRSTGRGELHYIDQNLAVASMTDPRRLGAGIVEEWGMKLHKIEVETTTIDDYLPDDIAVDLVKIDVEGHEPYVLMGMERTIRRSPTIRIIVEHIEELLEHTLAAGEFARYIHDLGFRICVIRKDWRLELHERGAPVPGNSYLLLTRSPEADVRTVARRRRAPRHSLKRALQGAAVGIGELSHRL
jgi:FkbM family methyltransferase